MQCDMCGKETSLVLAEVEGTALNVCSSCARYGKIIKRPRPAVIYKKKEKPLKKEPNLLVVEDYAQIIKNSREKMKLNQEQFARKVNEKESVIHSLEGAKMRPSINLARKLERFLGVRLVEEVEEEGDGQDTKDPKEKRQKHSSGQNLTIGDLIDLKK